MTDPEALELLTAWEARCHANDAIYAQLKDLFGASPETPVVDALYANETCYTESLGNLLDDMEGWLSWYRWEHDLGRKALRAYVDGKERAVASVADLWDVMKAVGE